MSHTITVTVAPDETSDDYEWTVAGDCESHCLAWWECLNGSHRHPSAEYGEQNGEWSTKRTPEMHQFINGMWMTQAGCGYDAANHGDLYHDLLNVEARVGDTFPIDIEWDGDYWNATLGPEDRETSDTLVRASDRGIGSITMFGKSKGSENENGETNE